MNGERSELSKGAIEQMALEKLPNPMKEMRGDKIDDFITELREKQKNNYDDIHLRATLTRLTGQVTESPFNDFESVRKEERDNKQKIELHGSNKQWDEATDILGDVYTTDKRMADRIMSEKTVEKYIEPMLKHLEDEVRDISSAEIDPKNAYLLLRSLNRLHQMNNERGRNIRAEIPPEKVDEIIKKMEENIASLMRDPHESRTAGIRIGELLDFHRNEVQR